MHDRSRRSSRLSLLAIPLAMLALPASALAAKAEVVDGNLRVTAASGEANEAGIYRTDAGDLEIYDNLVKLKAGAGCHLVDKDPVSAVCSPDGVTRVTVALGDRNDSFSIDDSVPPVSYSGGAGIDTVSYGGPTKLGSATVSLDGVANDGRGIAQDNIATNVERILGSFASDTLTAGTKAAAIDGSDGDDVMTGGPGDDKITSTYLSESGEDQGYVYRQGLDKISCGAGDDSVFADRRDEVAADCEVVGRPKDALTFEFTGSRKADRITVSQLIEALVHAGGGADVVRLTGGGNGTIYGEGGADDLKGASGYDRFSGGAGNDTIRARDRSRDDVSCGSGRDRVIADKRDRVAKDCERVSRR